MRRLETLDLVPLYEEHPAPGSFPWAVDDRQVTISRPPLLARSRLLALDGMTIVRGTSIATEDLELLSRETPPPVMLSFYIRGSVSGTWRASGMRTESSPGMHGIAFSPEPGFRFRLPGGVRHEVFEVNVSPYRLRELAERYPEIVEGILEPVLRGEPFALYSRSAACMAEATQAAARILSSDRHGSARRAFIEASVVELLALETDALRGGLTGPEARPPARRVVERMEQARAQLLGRLREPPGLRELAHLVGTNEFSLKRDFKAVFGNTVFGALFEHRMSTARQLLRDTELSVEEIADEVGYSSAAHFTTAFRRKFGFPPGALRRAG